MRSNDISVAYNNYSKYYDSLGACGRYPYSAPVDPPPDKLYYYYRKMSFEEFCRDKNVLMEFYCE